jgi:hypothetical protein
MKTIEVTPIGQATPIEVNHGPAGQEASAGLTRAAFNDPDLAPAAQSTPAEQVQEVEMRRTGTDNAPVVEMPKRATPPQPIPEELSRVYGGKITPEQAEAIQRRAKNRASVEIGLGGKFGDMARKSFMSKLIIPGTVIKSVID